MEPTVEYLQGQLAAIESTLTALLLFPENRAKVLKLVRSEYIQEKLGAAHPEWRDGFSYTIEGILESSETLNP